MPKRRMLLCVRQGISKQSHLLPLFMELHVQKRCDLLCFLLVMFKRPRILTKQTNNAESCAQQRQCLASGPSGRRLGVALRFCVCGWLWLWLWLWAAVGLYTWLLKYNVEARYC